MDRRRFLYLSSGLLVNASIPTICWSQERTTPPLPYYMLPTTHTLPYTLGNCAFLEQHLLVIKTKLRTLEKNWVDVSTTYKERIESRLIELRTVLDANYATASSAQRKKYIQAIFLGAGLLVAGIGIAFSGPYALGAAIGGQVILGTVELAIHSVFDGSTNLPNLVTTVIGDRAFLIGNLTTKDNSNIFGRLLNRTMTIAQLASKSWQLYHTNQEQKNAIRMAELARIEFVQVEKIVKQLGDNLRLWAVLYRRNLKFTSIALKSYIDSTRQNDCLLTIPITMPGQTGPTLKLP